MAKGGSVEAVVMVLVAFFLLVLPLQWVMAMIIASLFHEMCHYIAVRACGGEVYGVHVGLGGISMRVNEAKGWRETLCALAGPAGGFLLLIFVRWIPRIAVCASIQSLFNLLPVYPLDGGRALRSILAGRIKEVRAERIVEIVGSMVLVGVGAIGVVGSILLRVGVLPLVISLLIVIRGIYEKYLANRGHIRYNRGSIR